MSDGGRDWHLIPDCEAEDVEAFRWRKRSNTNKKKSQKKNEEEARRRPFCIWLRGILGLERKGEEKKEKTKRSEQKACFFVEKA